MLHINIYWALIFNATYSYRRKYAVFFKIKKTYNRNPNILVNTCEVNDIAVYINKIVSDSIRLSYARVLPDGAST